MWDKLPERMLQKISPEPNSGCWLWEGAWTTAGYGSMTLNYKRYYPHIYCYELANGPVPDGLELDHLCRMRCCCNPEHVEPVIHAENLRRGMSPLNARGKRTHCKRGHEFSDTNTKWYTHGKNTSRICLTCQKLDNAIGRARRKNRVV